MKDSIRIFQNLFQKQEQYPLHHDRTDNNESGKSRVSFLERRKTMSPGRDVIATPVPFCLERGGTIS
jgi:hypothetical protein